MDDLRIGSILKEVSADEELTEADIMIFGFSSDDGCVKNGGRAGASLGPTEVMKILPKVGPVMNCELDISIEHLKVQWYGKDNGFFHAHDDLSYALSQCWACPIVIGGSNDQSFPNALGLLMNFPDLDVINIDAHLDVRPGEGHSGSPFRELLNLPAFMGKFTEFAAQGNQCSKAHVDFVKSKGGDIVWLREVNKDSFTQILSARPNPLFVSFDIDSIRASDCPGVSCPSTRGLTADQALDICLQAGACERVVGLDLSEFNPLIENNITPRLVCQMIYHFLLGFSTRTKISGKKKEDK